MPPPHIRQARVAAAVWVGSMLMLGAYAVHVALGRMTHGFVAYYAAARLLLGHQLGPFVYDDGWFMRFVQQLTGTGVLEIFGPNTPAMALLLLPFAPLGPMLARGLWLTLSLAGFVGSVRALSNRGSSVVPVPLAVLALVLLSPPVFANLRAGQAYLLVFAALAVAVLALSRGRDALAGAMIGLSLLLKSSGLPLFVLLFVVRRFRAGFAALAVGVVGVAMLMLWTGADTWLRYIGYTLEFVRRPSMSVTAYQTTQGLFNHLCLPDPVWNPGAVASCRAVARVTPNLVAIGALAVTLVLARRAHQELWLAAGVSLSVLVVPVAEEHAFVVLGIPVLLLIRRAQARSTVIRWWPWAVLAVLLFVPLDLTARHFSAGWSALLAYPRLYAAWWLWAMTVVAMLEERHAEGVVGARETAGTWTT